jgi:two-component system NtrC family sensor kinase
MTAPRKDQICIVVADPVMGTQFERVLVQSGCTVANFRDPDDALKAVRERSAALLVVGEQLAGGSGLDFIIEARKYNPVIPALLVVHQLTLELTSAALKAGVNDLLCLPLRMNEFTATVKNNLQKAQQQRDWTLLEARRVTAGLKRRVDELETLARLGRSITSTLDVDAVLSAVVDAAVEMIGAEEGSLLLLDENTGELYMRASRNFNNELAQTLRMPIQDSLAGRVLSTGQPVLLDEKTPQKIKTSYLVHSLLYVPLQIKGHVFGVLGVDNRALRQAFQDRDMKILMALAEFAVIALENARLYANSVQERNQLETVITRIQDGVVVVDQDNRLLIVNETVQAAFGLNDRAVIGHPFTEVFADPELHRLVGSPGRSLSNHVEISAADGRVFSATATEIPDVGAAITMHDITYLKKLDRIKSDFVNTVSHDLRSPLTAILGYVELIERTGPVNERQHEYIHRVSDNVQNITGLMDDLLNLGHIESGFDTSKEAVSMDQIIKFSIDNNSVAAAKKKIQLALNVSSALPMVLANPVQMRQMVDNLIDNAIKYSPEGGTVNVEGCVELGQFILRVGDTGCGIPQVDLPYVFDKFYRGSNVATEIPGTGLGLSIVKSIVENHNGRVWVDSTLGKGSVFTIILPVKEETG